MSKEKSPFQKTAAALKIMGKKIAEKKNGVGNALQCVWITNALSHAVASDGKVCIILDLNYWGPLGKVGVIEELAFYADMQAISYINGYALITADKKEEFVKQYGHGMSVEGLVENKDDKPVPYPDFKSVLPNPESIQHVSKTGAAFYPGQLGVLDTVIEAFGVSYAHPTVANKLYGNDAVSAHIAIYPGILAMAMPIKTDSDDVAVVPSASEIGKFFEKTKHAQEEMNFEGEEKTEETTKDSE